MCDGLGMSKTHKAPVNGRIPMRTLCPGMDTPTERCEYVIKHVCGSLERSFPWGVDSTESSLKLLYDARGLQNRILSLL